MVAGTVAVELAMKSTVQTEVTCLMLTFQIPFAQNECRIGPPTYPAATVTLAIIVLVTAATLKEAIVFASRVFTRHVAHHHIHYRNQLHN